MRKRRRFLLWALAATALGVGSMGWGAQPVTISAYDEVIYCTGDLTTTERSEIVATTAETGFQIYNGDTVVDEYGVTISNSSDYISWVYVENGVWEHSGDTIVATPTGDMPSLIGLNSGGVIVNTGTITFQAGSEFWSRDITGVGGGVFDNTNGTLVVDACLWDSERGTSGFVELMDRVLVAGYGFIGDVIVTGTADAEIDLASTSTTLTANGGCLTVTGDLNEFGVNAYNADVILNRAFDDSDPDNPIRQAVNGGAIVGDNVTVGEDSGDTTLASVEANGRPGPGPGITIPGDVVFNNTGTLSVTGSVTATGSVSVAGTVTDVTLGAVTAADGTIAFLNTGFTTITGDVSATSGVSIGTGGTDANSVTSIKGHVESTVGDVIIGNMNSSTTVEGGVAAGTSSTDTSSITINGTIITVGADTQGSAAYATKNITFNSGGDTTVTGTVTSVSGDIYINGTGTNTMSGAVVATAGSVYATGTTTFEDIVTVGTAAGTVGAAINVSGTTTFQSAVTGDIVTSGKDSTSIVLGAHVGNLTIAAGTTHSIGADGSFSGGSIDNSGTLNNASGTAGLTIDANETFTNNTDATFNNMGLTTNNGAITNDGDIFNNGTITNNGAIINTDLIFNTGVITNDGAITNTGTIGFQAGSEYGTSGTGTIANSADDGYGGLTLGTLQVDGGITGFNALMTAVANQQNIGNVLVTGTVVDALDLSGATGGALTVVGDLNVKDVAGGDADVILNRAFDTSDPDNPIRQAVNGGAIVGANVTVGEDSGDTTLASVTANGRPGAIPGAPDIPGDVVFDNTGTLSVTGSVTATGSVSVAGTVTDATLGGPVTATNGTIAFLNTGFTTITGDVNAGNGVSIGAGGTGANSVTSIKGYVKSTNGDVVLGNMNSSTTVGGRVISEGGSITINGTSIQVGKDTVTNVSAYASQNITFNSSGDIDVVGTVTANNGDIYINGTGTHTMSGAVVAAKGSVYANGTTTFESIVTAGTAAGTAINVSGATTFQSDVTGNIVTSGAGSTSTVLGDHVGDLTIAAGTTHSIGADGSFSGGSIDNSGTLNNFGEVAGITIADTKTFTNNTGAVFNNAGIMTNNGVIANDGVIANAGSIINDGDIVNSAYDASTGTGGYIEFKNESIYAGTGAINNYGVILADIGMEGMDVLANATTLRTGSDFNIGDSTGSSRIDYTIDFSGNTHEPGSNVNLISPSSPFVLGEGYSINAGDANLNLAQDTVLRLENGSLLHSAASFTAYERSFLIVDDDAYATITAPTMYFVGDPDPAGGNGAHVVVGAGATLDIGATDVVFGANTYIDVAVDSTGSSLSTILTYGANVTLEGDVYVAVTGNDYEHAVGKFFLDCDTGTYDGAGHFISMDLHYSLVIEDGKVYFEKGPDSVVEAMYEMFSGTGYAGLSINKINGGWMTEATLDSPDTNPVLAENINYAFGTFNAWAEDGYINDAWIGLGQMYAEYAPYSSQLLRESNDFFWDSASQRFYVTQNKRISDSRGNYFGSNAISPEDAYAVVRGRDGGYDVCKTMFTVWAEGFGAWSRQRNHENLHGYNYDSGGFNLGFDYTVGRFDFSLFGGYTKGKLKLRDLATKYDGDIMNLGLSLAYTHESGVYGRAVFGYGRGWNDYDTNWSLGGTYHGKFDNSSISAGGEIGYIAQTDFMNIIPSVGLMYTHYRQDAWSESYFGVDPATPHWFTKQRLNTVDIPIGVRLNKVCRVGTMEIAPELRVAWIYSAKRDRAKIDMGYQGSGQLVTMYGVDPGRSRWLIGGGIKARFNQNWDANLDYNFVVRSRYHTHNVMASIGYSF